MKDFIYHNPTKVYFGKEQLQHLPQEILKFGKKVLMAYDEGAVKKTGLYDKIVKLANDNGITLYELTGIDPNPRHTTVNKGVDICAREKVDVILAIGGGSAIDCAKGIAAAAFEEHKDVWKVVKRGGPVEKALPMVTVLTTAATGSEMDPYAVISNMDTNEKLVIAGPALFPHVSFENPEDTYSLPAYQTACGAVDIFNHVLDQDYLAGDATFDVVRGLQEAVMAAVVKWAPIAMKEPRNYDARANLMWASSLGLNGMLDGGSLHVMACHQMEHELSAYYDITHGLGLAIITPRWLTHILNEKNAPEIYRLGVKVFGVPEGLEPMQGAKEAIDAVSTWCFKTLGLKSNLTELGIDSKHFKEMAEHACPDGVIPGPNPLTPADVEKIYEMCLH
ncbi:MAG: iron-containing alcohol dehydrogenase [Burkholderiales bacterium]|nr:iron-containing alcohol dehydrogenase [Burkholderiales bacterium]